MSRTFSAVAIAVIAAMSLAFAPEAHADYPSRPITMIVPWSAGGSTDQTGRALAAAAQKHLGQPIVILNRPGATTTLGMTELAAAAPDGYTIGTLSTSSYLVPLTGQRVPYDMLKSFSFISYYGDNLIGAAVLADKPWRTLQELIADGKARPGRITYGTAGVNTTQHLTTEALQLQTGARFIHVPQRGSAESMPALLGRHVDFITEVSVWAPFIEAGQVRLLALNTAERTEAYPDVPTFKELGFRSLRSVQAIIGPAGLPEDIRQKLEGAFRKALDDPSFREVMKRLRMLVVDIPGAEVRKLVEEEIETARDLIEHIKKGQ
jgi:tripartite-type tricarboxylate transporter receptor subunit TctC